MSFRGRMLLFFVIVVVIPMVAVGIVLWSLIAESEIGRADAELAGALNVATAVYEDARANALDDLREVSSADRIERAAVEGDRDQLARAATRLARRNDAVESIALYDRDGEEIAVVGTPQALAFATAIQRGPGGRRIGRIGVSTTRAREYVEEMSERAGVEARVVREGEHLAGTLPGAAGANPLATAIESPEAEFRGRYGRVQDAVGAPAQVGVFQDADRIAASIADGRRLVLAILLAFFVLALALSLLVVRSLGGQVGRLLGAARRLGSGDFDARVPADGRDEFAALAREFNLMSERLRQNVDELERRRREREQAIRRVGEAFASGLDRGGIARLAARSAVEACSAEAGRTIAADRADGKPASVGSDDRRITKALGAAESAARESPDQPTAVNRDGVHALATALRGAPEPDRHRRGLGSLAIARDGAPFDEAERDLFAYLAAQASVSLDNAGLHEATREEAVTDSLTGLYNRRHFDAALDGEIGRSRRFGGDVGLLMLDLDGFKPVNDEHGHAEGDRVLSELAALLRTLTRDVDHLARYGGDEIAVILPETDVEGAQLLAERVRAGVERLSLRPPGAAEPLPITASIGVAAFPESAEDRRALLRAADGALYQAKRRGGNRVMRADSTAVPR
ncbi:MAG: diguanylate cyclase [Thermoleophilaceae bacterium]|nr:diguanylate cyclase [Thermoleophilaceae bacterium]